MIGIVYSSKDPAGAGIAAFLLRELELRNSTICRNAIRCFTDSKIILAEYEEDVIYFDFLDDRLPSGVDFYLVLSRHSSEAGIRSYTVHATGNFSREVFAGGRPRELGIAHPPVMWFLLRSLYNLRNEYTSRENYEVSYEATHHGPTNLSKPIIFIEIGSTHYEWIDSVNHEIIGTAVIELINHYPNLPKCNPTIGIGGGHYPRKHSDLAISEDICYGHIASKHVLDYLDDQMLHSMRRRCISDIKSIVIEKKGTRREHRILIDRFSTENNLSIRYI
ncbi:MAG: D-aminoacyl-tRNA deacylase [Desulfurococcaceae archaeon]